MTRHLLEISPIPHAFVNQPASELLHVHGVGLWCRLDGTGIMAGAQQLSLKICKFLLGTFALAAATVVVIVVIIFIFIIFICVFIITSFGFKVIIFALGREHVPSEGVHPYGLLLYDFNTAAPQRRGSCCASCDSVTQHIRANTHHNDRFT